MLSDEQVIAVLVVEALQYDQTADAFVTAGRPERVERERAEAAVLEAYLPVALARTSCRPSSPRRSRPLRPPATRA